LHHGVVLRSRRVRIITTATCRIRSETCSRTQTEPKRHIQPTNIDSEPATQKACISSAAAQRAWECHRWQLYRIGQPNYTAGDALSTIIRVEQQIKKKK
jgi:hypothetical protein